MAHEVTDFEATTLDLDINHCALNRYQTVRRHREVVESPEQTTRQSGNRSTEFTISFFPAALFAGLLQAGSTQFRFDVLQTHLIGLVSLSQRFDYLKTMSVQGLQGFSLANLDDSLA